MGEFLLKERIMEISESDNWADAVKEWDLFMIEISDEFQTCLCSHYPIKELCIIKNKHTNHTVTVGNCCVHKFLGMDSHLLFSALKRIQLDETASANELLIDFIYGKNLINDWEYNFYKNIWRKRNLTQKMLAKKIQINRKILLYFSKILK